LVDWAQIASAVGTCGAVIVSLWLAQRKPQLDVGVSASMRLIVFRDGRDEPPPRFLTIDVVNKGPQPIVLHAVGWKVRRAIGWGFIRIAMHQFVETTSPIAPNPSLPITLAQGQKATFYLAAFGEYDWFNSARRDGFFSDRLTTRRSLKRLRVVASTSVGVDCYGRPGSEFLDELWVAMGTHRNSTT
jgi:hypothetical protein